MKLEITSGPDAGSTIEPAGESYKVGREDVDFLLADEEVSRQHFELRTLPDGGVEVNDLGSRNGTRVDGERITGPRLLAGGEEITIGVTTIKVEAPPPPPPPDPGATKVSASPPPADPDATAAGSPIPPGLGPDDATAPQPIAEPPAPPPAPSEPPTPPPPPAEPPTPPPPPAPTPAPAPPPPPAAPRAAAPPPPPRPGPGIAPPAGQASTGLRVTALVLSIVFALVGIFSLIVVAVALSVPLCSDPGLTFLEDCYNGGSGGRAIGAIVLVLGAIASIAFLVFSIQFFSKSRRQQHVVATGIAALLLLGIGLVVI